MSKLNGKHILMGVDGGTSCCGGLALVERFVNHGARVTVMPTRAARAFVTPHAFSAASRAPCVTDARRVEDARDAYVEAACAADLAVVAPATCALAGRMAGGFADEAILAALLSFRGPVLMAPDPADPAWTNPAAEGNLSTLRERGVLILDHEPFPTTGPVGARERAFDAIAVFEGAVAALTERDLEGLRVLITAGPTVEDIDPVRFISNRSTGRMGVALAAAAARRGARVDLVHGPLGVPIPLCPGLRPIPVRSARQMHEAVMARVDDQDVVILSAAVADFTPVTVAPHKLKKSEGGLTSIELTRTPDILAELGARERRPFLVGFAAESRDLDANARTKLEKKHCDVLCGNDISEAGSGFGSDTNRVTIYRRDGGVERLPLLPKDEVAHLILDQVGRSTAAATEVEVSGVAEGRQP